MGVHRRDMKQMIGPESKTQVKKARKICTIFEGLLDF